MTVKKRVEEIRLGRQKLWLKGESEKVLVNPIESPRARIAS
jgi:hypothetical protein